MEAIPLKAESDIDVGGSHGPRRRGQAVKRGAKHRIYVGNVHVIQGVGCFHAQLDTLAAAFAADSEVAAERGVERPGPRSWNGVASCVPQFARRWICKSSRIEVTTAVRYGQAGGFSAPAAHHA